MPGHLNDKTKMSIKMTKIRNFNVKGEIDFCKNIYNFWKLNILHKIYSNSRDRN